MKPELLYFCSNGLGENLCQTPVIRRFAKDYEVTVVCPDNCAVLFKNLPHVKQTLTWTEVGFKEYGDGTFHTKNLDKAYGSAWASGHYDHWNGNGLMHFHEDVKGDYISAYFTRVFGKEILTKLSCNDVTMDPPFQRDRSGPSPVDVLIFEGSTEPLRHFKAEYATKLYTILKNRGLDVGYFGAGEKGEEAFTRVNSAIQRTKLVVSPDSGPLHLALAHGCNVLALCTRELAENIINPVYYDQTHIWTMPEPECDRMCQGARFQAVNAMPRGYRRPKPWPKGIQGQENYPLCLECWGKTAPCLKLSDAEILKLANIITAILEHGHADTAQLYSNRLDVEFLPEASQPSAPPQPSSHNTDNSTLGLASPA